MTSQKAGFFGRSGEKDFPYFRKLWNTVVLALLAASLIPMILIGGGMYYYAVSTLKEKTLGALRVEILNHKEAVDQFLKERAADLLLVSSAMRRSGLESPGALEGVFRSLHDVLPCFTDLGVIDGQGRHLAYVGPYALLSRNYRDSEWFSAVMERGVYISDVFLGYRNVPHFIIAVKQEAEEGPWILRATVDTAFFYNLVSRVASSEGGDAFLVNSSGIFQTSPRMGGSLMGASRIKDLSRFEGVRVDEDGGRIRLMAWLDEVPWLCVVLFDRKEIYGAFHRIRNLGLYVFLLGTGMVVVTVLLSTNVLVSALERKRRSIHFLDHQLRQTSKAASSVQLASGFVREINDTLSNIDVVTRWVQEIGLKQGEGIREEIVECMDQIQAELGRGRGAAERFFRAIRPDVPMIREVDIHELLDDILELLDREIHFNRITVRREYREGLPVIRSDPSKIRQVFQNLLLNAVAAMERGGEIVLVSEAGEQGVTVQVKDNGPGIPKEHLERIFDPLFTTDARRTGLGLSLCAGLLKKLGGQIRVVSEPNLGATFVVTLPLQFRPPEA
ncbi:MAG: hypothetical protein JW821_12865 [Deltaproteobacteria bacterium]|nr:hypothetical protein [Deltaproteobacteria bacterium]